MAWLSEKKRIIKARAAQDRKISALRFLGNRQGNLLVEDTRGGKGRMVISCNGLPFLRVRIGGVIRHRVKRTRGAEPRMGRKEVRF